VLNEHTDARGELVFRQACAMGLEGIVSKRLTAPYKSGPSRDWLRVKNPDSLAMQRVRAWGLYRLRCRDGRNGLWQNRRVCGRTGGRSTPHRGGEDVTLLVTDGRGEPYLIPYPCKRTADSGWVNSSRGTPLAVTPLQWRPYVSRPKKR
jgi:hypothetical protein